MKKNSVIMVGDGYWEVLKDSKKKSSKVSMSTILLKMVFSYS